ncbi:MAG: inorganic phosphate transporter [Bacteroidaceae bacterium]|nr:inorganic phosphate transporter [Bacteroidaceae bacterium]
MDFSFLLELSGTQWAYLLIVVFLFVLAVIDLWVGVSNDAVNFLGSAVGSKAAKIKHVMIVAAVGVFVGAAFSNGMMEVARNGIFNPGEFAFSEVMVIYLAVMVSDVFLLDLFNSLGLPTSTTVSMVFELLGAAFITAILKISTSDADMAMANILNTDKALEMIVAIFLSVAIAFLFGLLVQWIARLIFTFHYKKNGNSKIGLFAGVAVTAIIYFMLIKGLKGTTIVSASAKEFIDENTLPILLGCFLFFSLLMQVLHWCKVNVLKIVVLVGTFSLALAFAGNDLVNFIGVTLAGFDSFLGYIAPGGSADMPMTMLEGSASTSILFLVGAGVIMVIALWTSKKARRVLQTSINLSSSAENENEMFGSSSFARNLVRSVTKSVNAVSRKVPTGVKVWVNRRFTPLEEREDVAFDLIRASVNLVLGGLLIAIGTSLKLPLSTTYVTFMVGMGSSLADRAWGRESAVYRVTGVVSVIGGWFITAGAAFILAAVVAVVMFFGGLPAMFLMIALVIYLLYRSSVRYKKKRESEEGNSDAQIMLNAEDKDVAWEALKRHSVATLSQTLSFSCLTYLKIFESFSKDSLRHMRGSLAMIVENKNVLKKNRRLETKAMQRLEQQMAFERSTWYHLSSNSGQQMLNTLVRIAEPVKEHMEHSFTPLPKEYSDEFSPYCRDICNVLSDIDNIITSGNYGASAAVSERAKELKHRLAALRKEHIMRIHGKQGSLRVELVYLNLIQESHELLSEVRNLLRGCNKYYV